VGTRARRLAREAAEERRNRRAVLFTILSLPAGFGSWAYFVLAANPAFYLGMALMVVSALFLIIATLEYFQRGIVKTASIVSVIIGLWFATGWAKSERVKKITSDVQDHLSIEMLVPVSGDAWDSLITTKNGSNFDIGRRRITCRVNQLNASDANGNQGVRLSNSGQIMDIDEKLKAGGDAQTEGCLTREGGGRIVRSKAPVTCADVDVIIDFSVDSDPVVNGTKELRFVYGFLGGQSWVQQPINRSGTYCPT
jgi:hypothetical protein